MLPTEITLPATAKTLAEYTDCGTLPLTNRHRQGVCGEHSYICRLRHVQHRVSVRVDTDVAVGATVVATTTTTATVVATTTTTGGDNRGGGGRGGDNRGGGGRGGDNRGGGGRGGDNQAAAQGGGDNS